MAKKKIASITREQAEEFTSNAASMVAVSYKTILWADDVGIPELMGYASLRDWVQNKLGGYIRYPIEERQQIAKELSDQGRSKVNIANALGVSDSTIGHDLNEPKPRNSKDELLRLVWEKVESRFTPFWTELVDSLEPVERALLKKAVIHFANSGLKDSKQESIV